MLNLVGKRATALITRPACGKIEWQNGSTYNTRWNYKWRNAYFTYIRDGVEPERVMKPEDSKDVNPIFWTVVQDFIYRGSPFLKSILARSRRVSDPYTSMLLPGASFFFYQFFDYSVGFKMLTILPLLCMYLRARDRCLDPDIKETYLRQIVFEHPQIKGVLNHNHTIVLDYDCEYDKQYPCAKTWPEFQNRFFQFFSKDGCTTSGRFHFADVSTKATLRLTFKTMPICGRFRFQVGEPYHFYDVRGQLTTADGSTKQIVIVDEVEQRKVIKPYLLLI